MAMILTDKEVGLMERTFVVGGIILAVLFSLICIAVLLWPDPAMAVETAASPKTAKDTIVHGYIGVEKCGVCHKADAKGNQLKLWQESRHAQAYKTLATKEAKALAAKVGLKGDPQKAPECLTCHTTAFGVETHLLGEKFKPEDGVQCEACHGGGADYWKIAVMKDRAKAIENGLVIPTEETCRRCHNETAPRMGDMKPFQFKDAKKKIAHPKPKTEAPAAKK